jgi:hypothetical protein
MSPKIPSMWNSGTCAHFVADPALSQGNAAKADNRPAARGCRTVAEFVFGGVASLVGCRTARPATSFLSNDAQHWPGKPRATVGRCSPDINNSHNLEHRVKQHDAKLAKPAERPAARAGRHRTGRLYEVAAAHQGGHGVALALLSSSQSRQSLVEVETKTSLD